MKKKLPKKLKNKYFIIRHGESQANVAGIILSHPEEGTVGFGLSERGKKQVQDSVLKNKQNNLLDSEIIIYSSDFLRTRETAEIVKKTLGIKEINLHKNLRERYFGGYDKTSSNNFSKVWEKDKVSADHTHNGVESVKNVSERVAGLINELDEKFEDKKILLVSHGDVLQILQTIFLDKAPNEHREITHLETAEIRQLK